SSVSACAGTKKYAHAVHATVPAASPRAQPLAPHPAIKPRPKPARDATGTLPDSRRRIERRTICARTQRQNPPSPSANKKAETDVFTQRSEKACNQKAKTGVFAKPG